MTLDAAMNTTLVRPVPLNVAIPSNFKLYPDEPYGGNHLWMTESNHEILEKTGAANRAEGSAQVRVSTSIAYDRKKDAFMCGPDCGEADVIAGMTQNGMKVIESDRRRINSVPVWLMHVSSDEPRLNAYMVYVATLIETNAVVFTWAPAENESGAEVWSAIKRAMFATPPDPRWEAAVNRPARMTPPIGLMSKLPAPTERVAALVSAASRTATQLKFDADISMASEGIVRVISKTPDGPVTLTLRFLDYGEEILLGSSARASGDATFRLNEVQRAFYQSFGEEVGEGFPIVAIEDGSELLVVMPRD